MTLSPYFSSLKFLFFKTYVRNIVFYKYVVECTKLKADCKSEKCSESSKLSWNYTKPPEPLSWNYTKPPEPLNWNYTKPPKPLS